MSTRNIFLYWVGKEYKLIKILRDLINLHSTNGIGYKVHLITDKNLTKYLNYIPTYFNDLLPAHQADFVRVNVICDYGGVWLDSDTLVLDSLDSLFDILEKKDGFFLKENNTTLCNGIFGSKKQTKLMKTWKNNIIGKLDYFFKRKIQLDWTVIGSALMREIFDADPKLFNNYTIFQGLDNIYPVNWINCVEEFIKKPYDNYKNIIREYQPLIVLVNSVYKELESKTEKEILQGNMPINYFFNKSRKYLKITEKKSSYHSLVESKDFIDKLNVLNTNLKKELENKNYVPTLIGNLFYDHEQMNPPFFNSPLLKDCEEKRKRFSAACIMRSKMFEVGLNGGHSSFLALTSNEDMNVYSNDIAAFYPPCPNIHPEVYVPEAARTLKNLFNNRFNFIKGSCLTEIPNFVRNNPEMVFDIIHIDGAKDTYQNDFLNIRPLLADNCIVIFDDSQNPDVQNIVNNLIKGRYLHRTPDFPQMNPNIKYRNEVLIFKK